MTKLNNPEISDYKISETALHLSAAKVVLFEC